MPCGPFGCIFDALFLGTLEEGKLETTWGGGRFDIVCVRIEEVPTGDTFAIIDFKGLCIVFLLFVFRRQN